MCIIICPSTEESLILPVLALAGVAPWIEFRPVNQMVVGSIPSEGTCLGCRPGPQLGVCVRGKHTPPWIKSLTLLTRFY